MNFHLHDWSKWSLPVLDNFGGEANYAQTRYCKVCDKVVIGRVRKPSFSRISLSDVLTEIKYLKKEQND